MSAICLLDTSYLLELYKVPDYFDQSFSRQAKEKIEFYLGLNAQLIVTLPCALQFMGHVNDSRDKHKAKKSGESFLEHFNTSRTRSAPWTITPSYENSEAFEKAAYASLNEFWNQKLTLCNVFTVLEARRLHEKYKTSNYDVYILTKNQNLKALEPTAETEPLV